MNNILQVNNLNKKYDGFSLQDVSFAVPSGYVMGFIGPNGAGKTTTIKSILGMVCADGGTIKILDSEVSTDTVEFKDDIGVVMDLPFYVDEWKVKDVEKAVSMFYSRWNSNAFKKYLKAFDISPDKKVKDLSRGMKVKLMLSAALSHEPKLLILDEPTSGLDPVARDELMDILRDFMSDESKGILFSTHITSDLEKIADYITFIIDGKIVFTGEKDKFIEGYLLVKGGIKDIDPEHKKRIIGYREHSVGFEGIVKAESMEKLPSNLAFEKPSLDEIIIYTNREGKNHE